MAVSYQVHSRSWSMTQHKFLSMNKKKDPEAPASGPQWSLRVVGERPSLQWIQRVSDDGARRSENAGTSNRKAGENPARRNTKVSFAMLISEGLVGPKGIPNGGLDG